MRDYAVAMTEPIHRQLCELLLRDDGQEDVCFALYRPLEGELRWTARIVEVVRPKAGDRDVHGNAAFHSQFIRRALAIAETRGLGVALLHSHPLGRGWQSMSSDDVRAEAGHAAVVLAASGHPLVGLTVASDRSWSARVWERQSDHQISRMECTHVRVVGKQLQITQHPSRVRDATPSQIRTVSFWGDRAQAAFAGLTIGIVGLGSVGSIVCETLARMGCTSMVLVDADCIETHNLDRTLGASKDDIGLPKVLVAEREARTASTAESISILPKNVRLADRLDLFVIADCDVVFSCVDRPLPRHLLNISAYAHLVPVIDGGILVRFHPETHVLQGADWSVHTVGPERPCLLCRGAYDLASVSLEMTGMLDDPQYIAGLPRSSAMRSRENVFPLSASVASFEVLQLIAMLSALMNLPDLQQQRYSYYPGVVRTTELAGCAPGCEFPSFSTECAY